jgi:cellulose synthase/poly-beta-1,6-N-acetylglucosamine synthase-like glycosyltransferase
VLKLISVIIPFYNTGNKIERCANALLDQSYHKNEYEIIFVDDGSNDGTAEIISKFKKIRLIKQIHKGPAVARNLGVKNSKGQIILFTDADCIPDKAWIKNMVEPFKSKEVIGVSGTYKTFNKSSLIARFAGYEIEERHRKLKKQEQIDFIGTFSAAFRKSAFLMANGFDESFPTASGEDPELSFRLEKFGKMIFQPKAFVYHFHPNTLYNFLRQKFYRGYWRVFLYKKHKHKIFKHSYTPKSLFIEEALIGITSLLLVLSLFKWVSFFYPLFFFIFTFLFTLPLSVSIFSKDRPVGLMSPFIILLRNFITGLGITCGVIVLLLKKIK